MVKEATRRKVLRASAIASSLGLESTSERLQRIPDKIRRFKAITDPERRLTQARWLSLEAETAEAVFKQDLTDKKEMMGRIGVSCDNTTRAIKARSIGLAIVDLSFAAMIFNCITSGAMTVGNMTSLLVAAAMFNLSFVASAIRIRAQMKLLKDGPRHIEEGIMQLKKEVDALVEGKA